MDRFARRLGMFVKYWRPGEVKTRLAADVGAVKAAHLYRCFVTTLSRRLADCHAHRHLVYWPTTRRDAIRAVVGDAWQLAPQSQGDLGTRMRSFFEQYQSERSHAAPRIVLIGSDSPTLPLAYIEQAFVSLRDKPVVLGPTNDGGYYLVGACGVVPPIFEGISWSTPRVWQQTMDRLAVAALPSATLPTWYDVDALRDLHTLREELCGELQQHDEYEELRAAVCRTLR